MVPMEDGIRLATDIFFPDGPGPFPTVLTRTPYHRRSSQTTAPAFTERGYAYVTQDCRGKYDSEGEFTPLVDEARDGHATLDWIANQKWCNGRIGMWGRSYLGIVQTPAASGGHEALQCIAPSVAPGSYFRDWIRYDGCFGLGNMLRWPLSHAACRTQPPQNHFTWEELHRLPSIEAVAERVGYETPCLADWVGHDQYDDYWAAIDQCLMHEKVRVPGYHSGGWFDHLTRSQFEGYQNTRDRGATESARASQRLVIGPWGHGNTGNTGPEHCQYGEWDFGPEADFPVFAHELQFYDYYLKEIDNGFSKQAPVKVFLMGENRWVRMQDWPPPDAQPKSWYLSSGGSANMKAGDGELAEEAPTKGTDDQFRYDPADPVPTRGGAIYWGLEHCGPVDLRPILDRPDVLYYRSAELAKALTVIGEVELELHIASSAEDTDFVARLCVEEVDGRVTCLSQGSLRCRYRDAWDDPRPLAPDSPTAIRVRLSQTAYTFPVGSRIGLVITSSDFPRILPHPNTMEPTWRSTASVIATNRILHGKDAPSRLQLPVIE